MAQVTAPVLSNINSESNLHSSTIDLGKSSLLLLSPDLNTVVHYVIPCIHPSLLSPTVIFLRTLSRLYHLPVFNGSIAPLAYTKLFAQPSTVDLIESVASPNAFDNSIAPSTFDLFESITSSLNVRLLHSILRLY